MSAPLIYGKQHNPILIVAPFFDIGSGWNSLDGASAQQDRNWECCRVSAYGFLLS
jgi:hypothetical protein